MNTHSNIKKIRVNEGAANWIGGVIGLIMTIALGGMLIFNGYTSVQGITILFGVNIFLQALGWLFPLLDVIAIFTEMFHRYFEDNDGRPVISDDARKNVWLLWFLAGALDMVFTFYILDKSNEAQVLTGAMHDPGGGFFIANRQWIVGIVTVVTYVMTIAIVHSSRSVLAGFLFRAIGGFGSAGWKRPSVRTGGKKIGSGGVKTGADRKWYPSQPNIPSPFGHEVPEPPAPPKEPTYRTVTNPGKKNG